jgi:hypothetical protein
MTVRATRWVACSSSPDPCRISQGELSPPIPGSLQSPRGYQPSSKGDPTGRPNGDVSVTMAPKLTYQTLVGHLDAAVESLLPDQIIDAGHPEHGGFVSARDGMAGGAHFGCMMTLGFAWLCEGSRYHGSEDVRDRLIEAAGFARAIRRPSGRYDLITTNWDCGPYTAFAIQAIAPVVAAARTSGLDGADQIEEQFGEIIRAAAPGMASGGFHTPNHRWVLTSALSQAWSLYPDLDVVPTIESYLSETIDINPDGEYTERSTAVYNAICNRSLRLTAEHLDRPELLDAVRLNLDASYHLLHADGSVVTSLSNRQDRGQHVIPVSMIDSYYALARIDSNGFYASVADWLGTHGRAGAAWSLEPFISHPEWKADDLVREPLPDTYTCMMPTSGVWRSRNGKTSATAATGITSPLSVRQGDIEVGLKVCATYFGRAQFRGDRIETIDDGIRLTFDGKGERREAPGYWHPVNRPVSMDDYRQVMQERDYTAYDLLSMTLDVTQVDGGFDVHLKTNEPFDNIPLEILFAFSPGGTLHSDSLIADGQAGHTAFLRTGYATYHMGKDAISIGPGACAHTMRDMRNSEPEPTAFRVLTTFRVPVDTTVEIRTGTWSEATETLLRS